MSKLLTLSDIEKEIDNHEHYNDGFWGPLEISIPKKQSIDSIETIIHQLNVKSKNRYVITIDRNVEKLIIKMRENKTFSTKEYMVINAALIENKLSQILDAPINVALDTKNETEKTLTFIVKIDKPKNYVLYNWLKTKIGEYFVLYSDELIIFNRLDLETVNEIVNKIKELNKEAWGFKIIGDNFDPENGERGIILSWEEEIPF